MTVWPLTSSFFSSFPLGYSRGVQGSTFPRYAVECVCDRGESWAVLEGGDCRAMVLPWCPGDTGHAGKTLSQWAWAAVTRYHRPGSFNNRNYISQFCMLQVWDQGAGKLGFILRLLVLTCRWLDLAVCSITSSLSSEKEVLSFWCVGRGPWGAGALLVVLPFAI